MTADRPIAIRLTGVSKKYPIYETPFHRLRESFGRGKTRLHREFWALQGIDLAVPAGTTLGILGQNGSGKTTLLQIIAGIMEPTTGTASVTGRVSTILELGAGFNPDFTGRENVLLGGLILGLTPAEMRERMEAIVDFAEIGEFLDRPVKTYSAGMYVRLAFALAVNLDPEVLVVDEVLAVGDAYFQHKCSRRIRDFQEAGKTIVYVTHDVESVRNLCHRAVILDYSRLAAEGEPGEIANRYMALIQQREKVRAEAPAGTAVRILDGTRYRTDFDFYAEFDAAEKRAGYFGEHPELLAQSQFPGGASPLPALLAHPDSEIIYRGLSIKPRTVLAFGIGLLPESWDKSGRGVSFRVRARIGDASRELAADSLDPSHNPDHRTIRTHLINLDEFAGQKISLVFSTAGRTGETASAWSCWIEPRLAVPREKAEAAEPEIPGCSRHGRREAEIARIEILDKNGAPASRFRAGEEFLLRFHVVFHDDVEEFIIGNIFRNKWGFHVYGMNTEWLGLPVSDHRAGEKLVVTFRQKADFASGTYSLNPATSSRIGPNQYRTLDWINNAAIIEVENPRRMEGYVSLPTEITIERAP
jgi:ABC-type polysaccharide/polyol phosphate transport system ATPase subunit